MRPEKRIPGVLLLLALGTLFLTPAYGQAWVGRKGTLNLYTAFQTVDVGDHLFSRNAPEFGLTDSEDFGDIRSRSVTLGVSYSITNRLAIAAAVPYVEAKYNGDFPEGEDVNSIDDGDYHGKLQDFSAEVRYMAVNRAFALTPFMGFSYPISDYEVIGHSAVGRNLKSLNVGVNLGWQFFPWARTAYVQGRYTYSFVEDIDVIEMDRSNAIVELGFFPTRSLGLQIFAETENGLGGADWLEGPPEDLDPDLEFSHDQTASSDYYRAGLGGSYALNSTVDVFVTFSTTLSGGNTHDATAYTFGTVVRLDKRGRRFAKQQRQLLKETQVSLLAMSRN